MRTVGKLPELAMPYGREVSREAKAGLDSQYESDDALMRHAFLWHHSNTPAVVKYVLAAGQENAEALACMIVAGVIPDLYLFRCDCLRAWRESGLVEQRRYQPWAVGFQSVLGQLKINSSSRIDR